MNRLTVEIEEALTLLQAERVFIEIHNGLSVPPLTDYYLQRIPPEWNSGPPPSIVGGNHLVPIFKDNDCYSIYCFKSSTNNIVQIDMEAPWPPSAQFQTWRQFKEHIFRLLTNDKSETEKTALRAVLRLDV